MTTQAPRSKWTPTVWRRRSAPMVALVALMGMAACGSGDDSALDSVVDTIGPVDTTAPDDTEPDDTQPVETTLPSATTAPDDTDPDDTDPPPDPDAETIATTFDPVSGTSLKFTPTVFVTSDPEVAGDPGSGSWAYAGGPPDQVTLWGEEFWILFQIQSVDVSGTMTSFSADVEDVASGLCSDIVPIPPGETRQCVAGPFPLAPGEQTFELTYDAVGVRQVFGSQFFVPPLSPPGYQNAPISYFVLYATSEEVGEEQGLMVAGTSTGPSIAVSGEVEGTLILDCDRPGAGIDLPVVAYGISFFDDGGGLVDGCFDVPLLEEQYRQEDGDSTVNFTGASTTTSSDVPVDDSVPTSSSP